MDLIYKFRLENDFKLKTSFSEGDNVLDEKEIKIIVLFVCLYVNVRHFLSEYL